MRLFLEISSLGSACRKMPFEPMEKTLLIGWSRYSPESVMNFLIKNGCILVNDEKIETYDESCAKIYKKHSLGIDNPENFREIKEKVVKEFTETNEKATPEQINQVKTFVENNIKKDCGTNLEKTIVKNKKTYTAGNSRMYYYNIGNHKIGGRHDAIEEDTLIEIKTRVKEVNVRKNEYDLYQLFGYLLALNKSKGKIVQSFGGKLFSSDNQTEKEYGTIDITEEYWKNKLDVMLCETKQFFNSLERIIETLEMDKDSLSIAIPEKDRPIAILNEHQLKSVSPAYSKLISHLSQCC